MAFWISLAVLLIAVVVGVVVAVVRGLQLWRNVKRTRARLGTELDRVNAATLRIDHHLAAAEAATGRLRESTARLEVSRAKLDVQLAAVREARAQVRRTFWFVPGL